MNEAAGVHRNLALFDFDGTLTTRETYGDFIRAVASPRRLFFGRILLAPLVLAYRAKLINGVAARAAITRVALRGVPESRARAEGARLAQTLLPTLLRVDEMARLRGHLAAGDQVVVVTGNFELMLAPWCAAVGVDLIASELAVRAQCLSGTYLGRQNAGEEKARRIKERYQLSDYQRIYAYGDTPEDAAMLALADRRFYRGQAVPA